MGIRSYEVETGDARTYVRNRKYLWKAGEHTPRIDDSSAATNGGTVEPEVNFYPESNLTPQCSKDNTVDTTVIPEPQAPELPNTKNSPEIAGAAYQPLQRTKSWGGGGGE